MSSPSHTVSSNRPTTRRHYLCQATTFIIGCLTFIDGCLTFIIECLLSFGHLLFFKGSILPIEGKFPTARKDYFRESIILTLMVLFAFANLILAAACLAVKLDRPVAFVPLLVVLLAFTRELDMLAERWKRVPEHWRVRLEDDCYDGWGILL